MTSNTTLRILSVRGVPPPFTPPLRIFLVQKIGYGFGGYSPPPLYRFFSAKRGLRILGVKGGKGGGGYPPYGQNPQSSIWRAPLVCIIYLMFFNGAFLNLASQMCIWYVNPPWESGDYSDIQPFQSLMSLTCGEFATPFSDLPQFSPHKPNFHKISKIIRKTGKFKYNHICVARSWWGCASVGLKCPLHPPL